MAIDLTALAAAITADALVRGFPAMSNAEVADAFNLKDQTRIRASMSGDEIAMLADDVEYDALTAAQKSQWLALCGRDSINPALDGANQHVVQSIFPAGGPTIFALAAARQESVSEAELLGLGTIGEADVWDVRGNV